MTRVPSNLAQVFTLSPWEGVGVRGLIAPDVSGALTRVRCAGTTYTRGRGGTALAVGVLLVLVALAAPAIADDALGKAYVLHLPGIGGERMIDHTLVGGLKAGGLGGVFRIYDWTGGEPGLLALTAVQRNQVKATAISAIIVEQANADPRRPIVLTCHSGGAGLAAWALEQLPQGVMVDAWLMVAPALSPHYDLSAALRHVRRRAYTINSQGDIVLGQGTRMFGTIDGVKSDAAGRVGFVRPDGADAKQYEKLTQLPYDVAWLKLGNAGDHVGAMNTRFAREVLAPLLLTGKVPHIQPATGPTSAPAAAAR